MGDRCRSQRSAGGPILRLGQPNYSTERPHASIILRNPVEGFVVGRHPRAVRRLISGRIADTEFSRFSDSHLSTRIYLSGNKDDSISASSATERSAEGLATLYAVAGSPVKRTVKIPVMASLT